jgi:hypothetical protein
VNPRLTGVRALPDMVLQLEFHDGRHAYFDVAPYVQFPVFQRLKDPVFFGCARVDHGTVQWPGGVDFDPDTLYLESRSN